MGTEGESLLAEQRTVLQAIYNWFRDRGTWPTFTSIDRPLRRSHGLDTRPILGSLPDVFLVGAKVTRFWLPSDELRLRLAGIDACQGGTEETERFVRLLRWLARKEIEFEPEADSIEAIPRVTSDEVGKFLNLAGDTLALRRLCAMLQLDNWGINGTGGDADEWYILLGSDIWRFRDVQTVDDCVEARRRWVAKAVVASPWARTAQSNRYYHVRVSARSNSNWDEVQLDLSGEELESRFLAPRREGRPIVVNGKTIPMDDLTQLRIGESEQPSDELRPIVQAKLQGQVVVASGLPEEWHIADHAEDVTDRFIIEPVGTAALPLVDAVITGLYVNAKISAEIRGKENGTAFDVGKLLTLIEELNDNYQKKNSYSAHALLRAILDHIPPILGRSEFRAVANNYSWGRTDKRYMKKLLEFRDQADDALHRPISARPDLLDFDDMPSSVYVDRLLQECADKL